MAKIYTKTRVCRAGPFLPLLLIFYTVCTSSSVPGSTNAFSFDILRCRPSRDFFGPIQGSVCACTELQSPALKYTAMICSCTKMTRQDAEGTKTLFCSCLQNPRELFCRQVAGFPFSFLY
uniref:Putative secreted protein n=1 Tax=Amblyomma cajennense TaxID=34607 RepID=A0A023FBV8_AMBCJ